MLNKLEVGIVLCLVMSNLPHIASAKHKPPPKRKCYQHGKHDERCKGEQTHCAVNSLGASAGCITASECGSAVNQTALTCDVDHEICCCLAREKSCNDYLNEDFKTNQLCPAFPDATPCQLAAGNFTKAYCRLANGKDEECKLPVGVVACSTDTLGRSHGCKPMKECPLSVEYFDPKCDYEKNLCCCQPLVEGPCNARSNSPELEILLKEMEDKMRKDDNDPHVLGDAAMFSLSRGMMIVPIVLCLFMQNQ